MALPLRGKLCSAARRPRVKSKDDGRGPRPVPRAARLCIHRAKASMLPSGLLRQPGSMDAAFIASIRGGMGIELPSAGTRSSVATASGLATGLTSASILASPLRAPPLHRPNLLVGLPLLLRPSLQLRVAIPSLRRLK
jgi:hypothetical protein